MVDKDNLVSIGLWYYDGTVKTGVAIEKRLTVYGTGDYEDNQDIQTDTSIENYYIWFATTGTLDDFRNGAGYRLSIKEAKEEAERLVGQKIEWINL